MKKFSFEQLKYVSENFKSKQEAAAYLGTSTVTLSKYLKEYNLALKPNILYPFVDKAWLITNWVNTNDSIATLAKKYNISESVLEARILKFKLTKKYKHSLNLKKLFDLSDPHIWYLAGLFATDGYFPANHDMVTIELTGESEKQLLENICQYYESSQPVREYLRNTNTYSQGTHRTAYWQISTDGLQKFFAHNFGISLRNKTFTLSTPSYIPSEDCAKAYILGCLDGDGYISKKPCIVTLCTASEDFVKNVGEIVKQYAGIEYYFTYTPRSGNREFPLVSWKTNRARALLTWVYSLDNCFRLERKYQRFLDYYKTTVDEIV